jgi:hypothetical protein
MINKLTYLIIIAGVIALLTLIPGFIDGSIYFYYRIKNGNIVELNNNCFSVPDGWFKATKNIDTLGYSFLKVDKKNYEIISVFIMNETFHNNVQNSLEQVNHNSYHIFEAPDSLKNNETLYWLIIPQYDLVVEGSTITITESFARNFRLTGC